MTSSPGAEGAARGLVLILTLNEEATIGSVLAEVRSGLPDAEILVVDGESKDRTREIARESGAAVVSLSPSLAIAGAMEVGLAFAAWREVDQLIRLDADGQHRVSEIVAMRRLVEAGEADIVIGSRFAGRGDYRAAASRSFAIRIFSLFVSWVAGQKISDPTSGLQVMSGRAVRYLAGLESWEYSEINTIVIANKAGLRVREVPVEMNERQGGRSSFSPARAFFYVFTGLFDLFLESVRRVEEVGERDA